MNVMHKTPEPVVRPSTPESVAVAQADEESVGRWRRLPMLSRKPRYLGRHRRL